MSAALEALARDKQLLLARSSLGRLQLRRRTLDLRHSLPWNSAAVVVTAAPALRRVGFGIVASLAGIDRTARCIRLASRVVRIARLAGAVISDAGREPLRPAQGTDSR